MDTKLLLSHTPPAYSVSIGREPPLLKKNRSGSISGKLGLATDVYESGQISYDERGKLKELIIKGDERANEALEQWKSGRSDMLKEILKNAKGWDEQFLPLDFEDFDNLSLNVRSPGGSLGSSTPKNSFTKELLGFSIDDSLSFQDDISTWQPTSPKEESPSVSSIGQLRPLPVKLTTKNETYQDEMFDFDYEDNRTAESFFERSRIHKDSLLEIDDFNETFSEGKAGSLVNVFQDDYRDNYVFGDGDLMASTNPIGIPPAARRRGNNYTTTDSKPHRVVKTEATKPTKMERRQRKSKTPGDMIVSGDAAKVGTYAKAASDTPRRYQTKKLMAAVNEEPQVETPNLRSPEPLPAYLIDRSNGYVGAYSPEARRQRVAKFLEKRPNRVWQKKVKYDVRKNFADSRLRVKGRFVKKEDEELLREFLLMTI